MTCPAPIKNTVRLIAVISEDLPWDLQWSEKFRRLLGGDSGPSDLDACGNRCCCECGTIVQTDLIARVSDGRVVTVGSPPSLSDPALVRHVPWAKFNAHGSGGCHSQRRLVWSDIGRMVAFGTPRACIEIVGAEVDGITWYVNPPDGQIINPGPGSSVWEIWLDYEIRCCNCYDDAQWRLTDSATMGSDGTHLFVAPPYATSVQIQQASFVPPSPGITIEVEDAAGNVIWSTTTTAAIYALRWPDAHALRISASSQAVFTLVTWEGA